MDDCMTLDALIVDNIKRDLHFTSTINNCFTYFSKNEIGLKNKFELLKFSLDCICRIYISYATNLPVHK